MAERTGWQRFARRMRVPMGFTAAGVFLWWAQPSAETLPASLLLVVPGLWLRGYAAGFVRKNAELTTSGPYGYTRNPLYLGSLLITLGFGAATGNWIAIAVLAAVFLAVYLPTIRGEEEYLRRQFSGFAEYAARVPRLLPRLPAALSEGARGEFSRALYLHHREYNAVMGAGAIYAVLVLKMAARHYRFDRG